MKQINYTGSSKLIARIIDLLNKKAPLPLDQQGEVDWGTDGKVLATDGVGGTKWVDPSSGGGDVTDVEVNGTSVVNAQGVAEVTVPTKTSDLNNDSDFIDSTDLSTALADYTPTASLASVATSGQYSDLLGTPSLATVATSGDYDDLTNKPTIPAAQVNSDWNASSGVAEILNKPTVPSNTDYIRRDAWWQWNATHDADDLRGGTTFAYSPNHSNTATTGTLVAFDCSTNEKYGLQIQGSYNSNELYFRNRNGDGTGGGSWNPWRNIIHSGNIGTQSVANADSATNADKVDNFHIFSERYVRFVDVAQPTAGAAWGLCVSTGDWDSLDHVIQLRCGGSNYSATAVLHTSARSTSFWGYQSNYNGKAISGAIVSVDSATRAHFLMPSNVTTVRVYMDFFGSAVAENALTTYFTLDNGFFRSNPRTVTALVNESTTIAINSTKTYAALTLSALQAYDEVHFMLATGNVLFNGMWTKGQMNFISSITSGKMYIYGGNVQSSGSIALDYVCKVYADAGGLKILNLCKSTSIDKVLIEGIKYN